MALASTATTAPSTSGTTESAVSATRTRPGPSMSTCSTGSLRRLVDTMSTLCTITDPGSEPAPGWVPDRTVPPVPGEGGSMRNPHAGEPFVTSDREIAEALADLSVPTLMLSLVHMSGDPELIRGRLKPAGLFLNEVQGFMAEEDKAEIRALPLDVIRDYRDRGCPEPEPVSSALLHEMMAWLVCEEVPAEYVPMLMEEMELDCHDDT